MKRVGYILLCTCAFILLGMGACVPAHAQTPGSTCRYAIPLTKDYTEKITKAGTEKWYSAWTFDLPLSVSFIPDAGASAPAPEVEMDFSCTSGYYEDSILCSLFCKTSSGSGIQFDMPYKQTLEKGEKDGKFAYTLSLGKRYRDLLLQMGISYNLKVVVKVKYTSTGGLTMNPDAFTDCMDGPKFMRFGDTVNVVANDKKRHVIVPYLQWQEDTILYVWDKKATAPCVLAVANSCEVDVDDTDEQIDHKTIYPGDSLKVKADAIYKWVHDPAFPNEAGMYFAKFYSTSAGVMKIIKAPQAPPRGKGVLMSYGRTYALDANSTAVYAIPTSWKDTAVKFITPTTHVFTMVIDTTPNFNSAIKKEYQFNKTDTLHWLGLTSAEIKTFADKTKENYLYLRFICSEATTITPDRWSWSTLPCYAKPYLPFANETTFRVDRSDPYKWYKIYLDDWAKGDMTASFSKTNKCGLYVSETCTKPMTSEDASNWLKYLKMQYKNEVTITQADFESWQDDKDENGYIYIRFYTTVTGGEVTIKSTAQKETDPVYPHTAIDVKCEGSNVIVEVSEEMDIMIEGSSESWHAVPGTPHILTLPAGTYVLSGNGEKITITLP